MMEILLLTDTLANSTSDQLWWWSITGDGGPPLEIKFANWWKYNSQTYGNPVQKFMEILLLMDTLANLTCDQLWPVLLAHW